MPKRARDAAVTVAEVGPTAQGVWVQRGLDDPAPDHPRLDLVLLGLVQHFFLGHAPLQQHFAADRAPILERVDGLGTHGGVVAQTPFSAQTRRVHGEPVAQATGAVGVQHRPDGVLVVAVHPDHRGDLGPAQFVALDQRAVVDALAVLGGVDHQRVHALPVQRVAHLDHRLGRAAGAVPGQLGRAPHDGAFDERCLEHRQVVDELVQRFQEAALHHDVLDLGLGPGGLGAGVLGNLLLGAGPGIAQHLANLIHLHGLRRHLGLLDQLLHALHDLGDHLRRQLGLRGGVDRPGFIRPGPDQHVGQQSFRLPRFRAVQKHKNGGAPLRVNPR